jgi:hypothetical protein
MKKLLLAFLTTSFFAAQAQDADTYNADVPNHYFSFTLKLTKEGTGFTPPVASRAFGFTGLALYEAVVAGIPSMTSTIGAIPEFTNLTPPDGNANYHWPTVANNALASVIDSLWANASQLNKDSLHTIRDYYNTLFEGQISAQDYADSKAYGEAIGNDVFQFSKTDGGHQAYSANFPPSYVPPVGPGLWQAFGSQTAMQPYWGSHRPFVTDDTTSVIPGPPPSFSTDVNSPFYAYAFQVYYQVNNNTADQVTIAQYWADGGGTITPPGHSIAMLRNILRHENSNLETAAIAYAKMGIALSDAFLACWKTKYIYNCLRPVTYIQANIDANWVSLIGTPPFPEYSSGHSSQSGAMSEILESIFGTSYAFVDSTHGTNFGGPRSFLSFDEAAEEAAVSRLYGGIHYEFGNNTGLAMGRQIGENINDLFAGLAVGVAENNTNGFILEMYPNPATDVVNFYGKGFKIDRIEIYNMMGQQVAVNTSSSGTMDVSDLASGFYAINAYDLNKGVMVSKTLVRK